MAVYLHLGNLARKKINTGTSSRMPWGAASTGRPFALHGQPLAFALPATHFQPHPSKGLAPPVHVPVPLLMKKAEPRGGVAAKAEGLEDCGGKWGKAAMMVRVRSIYRMGTY